MFLLLDLTCLQPEHILVTHIKTRLLMQKLLSTICSDSKPLSARKKPSFVSCCDENAPDADIDACRWTTLEQVAAQMPIHPFMTALDACSQSMSCRETDITDLIKEIHQVPPSK